MVEPGIEPGTSVSVARNSDHKTTEAVISLNYSIKFLQLAELKVLLITS
jgi:hypothetical protein